MKKGHALFSPFGLAQIAMIATVAVALWLAFGPWRWGQLKEEVRAGFPSVPRISGEDLSVWMKQPVEQPLLLDARSEAEYNESYLPGALRSSTPLAQLGIQGKFDQPLVIYCTVGFDSARVAHGFILRGYKRVQYLEGGIFLWADEGRPLENIRGPATKVLPGNSPYVSYLHLSKRAP